MDANGVDLTLFEYCERRFLRKVRRLELCTGEAVVLVKGELLIATTGERLKRGAS